MGESPAIISSLQQGTPLKYKTNRFIPENKSPKRRRNKVSGCTHWSDLPYCMEPVSSQMSIPCSDCQVLGQPVPLRVILKGRSSGQEVPVAARALLEPNQGRLATSSKAPGWLHQNLLPSLSSYCLPHDRLINQEMRCWGEE